MNYCSLDWGKRKQLEVTLVFHAHFTHRRMCCTVFVRIYQLIGCRLLLWFIHSDYNFAATTNFVSLSLQRSILISWLFTLVWNLNQIWRKSKFLMRLCFRFSFRKLNLAINKRPQFQIELTSLNFEKIHTNHGMKC